MMKNRLSFVLLIVLLFVLAAFVGWWVLSDSADPGVTPVANWNPDPAPRRDHPVQPERRPPGPTHERPPAEDAPEPEPPVDAPAEPEREAQERPWHEMLPEYERSRIEVDLRVPIFGICGEASYSVAVPEHVKVRGAISMFIPVYTSAEGAASAEDLHASRLQSGRYFEPRSDGDSALYRGIASLNFRNLWDAERSSDDTARFTVNVALFPLDAEGHPIIGYLLAVSATGSITVEEARRTGRVEVVAERPAQVATILFPQSARQAEVSFRLGFDSPKSDGRRHVYAKVGFDATITLYASRTDKLELSREARVGTRFNPSMWLLDGYELRPTSPGAGEFVQVRPPTTYTYESPTDSLFGQPVLERAGDLDPDFRYSDVRVTANAVRRLSSGEEVRWTATASRSDEHSEWAWESYSAPPDSLLRGADGWSVSFSASGRWIETDRIAASAFTRGMQPRFHLRPTTEDLWTVKVEVQGAQPGLEYPIQLVFGDPGVDGIHLVSSDQNLVVRGIRDRVARHTRLDRFVYLWSAQPVLQRIVGNTAPFASTLMSLGGATEDRQLTFALGEPQVEHSDRVLKWTVSLENVSVHTIYWDPERSEMVRPGVPLVEFLEAHDAIEEYNRILNEAVLR
jgi:hypothetical protein